MRPTALLVSLACVIGACGGGDGGSDGGPALDAPARDADASARDAPRDGSPDADPYCHWDCFRSFFCRDGAVHESAHMPIPCAEWRGECPHWPIEVACERGCREGVWTDRAEDVCEENVPKREGDPCSAPEHCTPGMQVPDGFGGWTELALDCDLASGTCVRRAVERCDGSDDDGDGAVDEGCAITPSIPARISAAGAWRDVAFAGDRIALLSESDGDVTLAIVDPDGASIRVRTGLRNAHGVERVAGAFAVLRHPYGAGPDEIVLVRDDGTEGVVPIASPPATRYARLVPLGDDWIVLGIGGDPELVVQAHDGSTGARLGATRFTPPSSWMQHAPLGDDALLLSGDTSVLARHRVTRGPSVVEIGPVDPSITGWISAPVLRRGEILVAARGPRDRIVARIDGATGAWLGRIELGALGGETAPAIATAGTEILASWLDEAGVLRSILVDDTGARVGASEIALGMLPYAALFAGETVRGPRVVVAGADADWILVAPAIR